MKNVDKNVKALIACTGTGQEKVANFSLLAITQRRKMFLESASEIMVISKCARVQVGIHLSSLRRPELSRLAHLRNAKKHAAAILRTVQLGRASRIRYVSCKM